MCWPITLYMCLNYIWTIVQHGSFRIARGCQGSDHRKLAPLVPRVIRKHITVYFVSLAGADVIPGSIAENQPANAETQARAAADVLTGSENIVLIAKPLNKGRKVDTLVYLSIRTVFYGSPFGVRMLTAARSMESRTVVGGRLFPVYVFVIGIAT